MSEHIRQTRSGSPAQHPLDAGLDPMDPASHHLLEAAEGFHMIGLYEATIEELDKIQASFQEYPSVLHLRTRAHWHLRELPQAMQAVNRYLQVRADHPFGYGIKAQILILQGHPAEAYQLAKTAIALFPDHGTMHYDLALACAKYGHWPEARDFAYVAMCVHPGLKSIILDSEYFAPIKAQLEAMDPHN